MSVKNVFRVVQSDVYIVYYMIALSYDLDFYIKNL